MRPAVRMGCQGALIAALVALGACDGATYVHFLQVDDGTYLKGVQTSRLDVSGVVGTHEAVRAELYLDGARVAGDEFAPFELTWDTSALSDGKHRLKARVFLDQGGFVDDEIGIILDNTPPVLGTFPPVATRGRAYDLPATDNLGIERIEVSRGVQGEAPIVISDPAATFAWPWGCEPVTLHVRVIDRAGGETSATASVASTERVGDQDCDGHLAISAGGDDCNDVDPTIYPRAPEYPDGVDRNCDGVTAPLDSIDADHDGVPSLASGGGDCDDNDPTVHGTFYVMDHLDVVVAGQPVRWNPGEAAVDQYRRSVILNRNGAIDEIALNAAIKQVHIADGANPGSIAIASDELAFGRGNQVVIFQRSGESWVQRTTIDADAPVGRLAFEAPYSGAQYAVFQAGTKVWFAKSANGVWTTQLILDAGAPLAEPPFIETGEVVAYLVFRTVTTAWESNLSVDNKFITHPLEPAVSRISAAAQALVTDPILAVDQGSGSALYSTALAAPLSFPRRVTGMFLAYPHLFVKLEGLDLQVFHVLDHFRRIQTIPGVGNFDAASGTTFAGDGRIYFPSTGTVLAPPDSPGDHRDVNCDGSD